MSEILTATGHFINAFGLPTLISVVSVWVFVREVPKQRLALAQTARENRIANAEIARENRQANEAIAQDYKESIEKLFSRTESQITKISEDTSRLISSAAEAHAESVRRKDERIIELTENLLRHKRSREN